MNWYLCHLHPFELKKTSLPGSKFIISLKQQTTFWTMNHNSKSAGVPLLTSVGFQSSTEWSFSSVTGMIFMKNWRHSECLLNFNGQTVRSEAGTGAPFISMTSDLITHEELTYLDWWHLTYCQPHCAPESHQFSWVPPGFCVLLITAA